MKYEKGDIRVINDDSTAIGKRTPAFLKKQDGIVYVVKYSPHHDVFQRTLPEWQLRGVADNIDARYL